MPNRNSKSKFQRIITLDQIDVDSVTPPLNESYQDKLQRKIIKKKNDKRTTRGKNFGKS